MKMREYLYLLAFILDRLEVALSHQETQLSAHLINCNKTCSTTFLLSKECSKKPNKIEILILSLANFTLLFNHLARHSLPSSPLPPCFSHV